MTEHVTIADVTQSLKAGVASDVVEQFNRSNVEENTELLRLQNESLKIANDTSITDRNTRERLIRQLTWLSYIWLGFTGVVVVLQGLPNSCFHLEIAVAVAFITTSLGTVLGLWAIGLGYFFRRN